jgi:RNA polymerase subunit RPABC4/transcription elongation factor Spt4
MAIDYDVCPECGSTRVARNWLFGTAVCKECGETKDTPKWDIAVAEKKVVELERTVSRLESRIFGLKYEIESRSGR